MFSIKFSSFKFNLIFFAVILILKKIMPEAYLRPQCIDLHNRYCKMFAEIEKTASEKLLFVTFISDRMSFT